MADRKVATEETVIAKTGKSWAEWYKLLDKAGAKKLDHGGIVRLIGERYELSLWWSQMVTVGYERERGLRQKYETATGFRAYRSKTFPVSLEQLYGAWEDAPTRRSWLKTPKVVIRKATSCKSMRITWNDGTNVEVLFTAKGDAKSQVAIDHSQLADAAASEAMKAFWAERLQTLAALLAKGKADTLCV